MLDRLHSCDSHIQASVGVLLGLGSDFLDFQSRLAASKIAPMDRERTICREMGTGDRIMFASVSICADQLTTFCWGLATSRFHRIVYVGGGRQGPGTLLEAAEVKQLVTGAVQPGGQDEHHVRQGGVRPDLVRCWPPHTPAWGGG